MSDNNHAKAISPSRFTFTEAKSQETASSTQNTPGTPITSQDHKENEEANKDSILAVKPEPQPPKATDPTKAAIASHYTNTITDKKDIDVDNKSNDKKTRSTYEIDGITYQYGIAYPNRAQPEKYQRPKWGVYPNMMSYVDDAGVKHEIHIPTGMYHRAAQLFVAEDWEQLGKFPAYEGRKYTEADWYRLDDSHGDDGDKSEEVQNDTTAGTGDPAMIGAGRDTVQKA